MLLYVLPIIILAIVLVRAFKEKLSEFFPGANTQTEPKSLSKLDLYKFLIIGCLAIPILTHLNISNSIRDIVSITLNVLIKISASFSLKALSSAPSGLQKGAAWPSYLRNSFRYSYTPNIPSTSNSIKWQLNSSSILKCQEVLYSTAKSIPKVDTSSITPTDSLFLQIDSEDGSINVTLSQYQLPPSGVVVERKIMSLFDRDINSSTGVWSSYLAESKYYPSPDNLFCDSSENLRGEFIEVSYNYSVSPLYYVFAGGEIPQPASQPINQPASQPINQPASQPSSQPTSSFEILGGGFFGMRENSSCFELLDYFNSDIVDITESTEKIRILKFDYKDIIYYTKFRFVISKTSDNNYPYVFSLSEFNVFTYNTASNLSSCAKTSFTAPAIGYSTLVNAGQSQTYPSDYRLYFGSSDGYLYAYGLSGDARWNYSAGENISFKLT